MNAGSTVKDLKDTLDFAPTKENSGRYVMPFKKSSQLPEEKMTDQDWDQFEKDIVDAFEQIP